MKNGLHRCTTLNLRAKQSTSRCLTFTHVHTVIRSSLWFGVLNKHTKICGQGDQTTNPVINGQPLNHLSYCFPLTVCFVILRKQHSNLLRKILMWGIQSFRVEQCMTLGQCSQVHYSCPILKKKEKIQSKSYIATMWFGTCNTNSGSDLLSLE